MIAHPTRPLAAALIAMIALVACGPQATAGTRATPAVATAVPAANPAPAATSAPAAASAAAAPAATQAPAATSPGQPPQRVTVHAGGLGGSIDRPYFVGREKGFYNEVGIDVDVDGFRSASEMVPLLATGRLDVGHGSTSPGFFNALLAGVPVKIVTDVTLMRAPGEGIRNSQWLLARKELIDNGSVKGVADLRGRKVAINNVGTLSQIQIAKILAFNGLAEQDVDVTAVAFPDQIVALANGAIDAGLTVEPFVTQAQARNIAIPIFDTGWATPNEPAQSLFYGPDFIRTQPDVARRFLIAYMKSLRYMEDAFFKGINKDEAIQIFMDNTPVKDAALWERLGFSYGETNGNVNMGSIDTDQDFYIQHGFQKEKIDPRAIVDTTFAENAVQVLGRYQ